MNCEPTAAPAAEVTLAGQGPTERSAERDETQALLLRYLETRDLTLRNELVNRYDRLVRAVASRFSPSAVIGSDDLVQAGYLGLISALERYDPTRGCGFVTFAVPTIVGTIKHYLRDHTWALHAPRRLRELATGMRRLVDRLEQQLGRTPTPAELAEAAGVSEERILQAMEVDSLYRPGFLDLTRQCDDQDEFPGSCVPVGFTDPEYGMIEERDAVKRAIERLGERERAIIYYRFFGEASQKEVAGRLGISQMHVSRLERRALQQLKALLS